MSSAWIEKRKAKDGNRFRVRYRLGGRESIPKFAGSFRTQREALTRRQWVLGELAAMRPPDLTALSQEPATAPTLREAADRWRASRVDVAEGTRKLHKVALGRVMPQLASRNVDDLTVEDIAELVTELDATGYKRETIRKSLTALAQVLDHAGVNPNVARDRIHVRLPREERKEIEPPTAAHVETVVRSLAPAFRLPTLTLDATGMRLNELIELRWGDIDEKKERWRISRASEKTRRGRWVPVPPDVFAAVLELKPREDRDPAGRVFTEITAARLRMAILRACKATGTPAFSPHSLRHRRISLWHRLGVSWAEIGSWVGQRSLSTTADTYSHVLPADDTEVNRENPLTHTH